MKKLFAVILLCVMMLGLGCCGSQEDESLAIIGGADGPTSIFLSGKTDGSDLIPITVVLDWVPNVNHIGVYAAQALGYYAEQGLDVSIIQPGDNYALQLVAAGQADIGFSYQEEVTFARESGIPVLSLAAVIQHNTSCFGAPVSHNIKAVEDFAGKRYAGWGGQVEEALLNYLLDQAGLDRAELVNIGSSDFFSAMESGFDFSWIFYAVTGVEAELRGVELDTIWLRDIDPAFDYYTPVLAAEESWAGNDPEQARAFLTATARGYQYADEHPAEAGALLLAACPELDEGLVLAGAEWMAGRWQDDAAYWGWQDPAVWSGFSSWLAQRQLISDSFEPEAAYSNEYLAQ